MACTNPFDAFRLATESLPRDIFVRASYRSIYMNLIPRGVFPQGAGVIRSTFTAGRTEPTDDEPAFNPVAVSSGGTYTGACAVTYNNISVGFNEGTYKPENFGWMGPPVCQDDLMINYNMENFLALYVPAITKFTERTISNRYDAIYTNLVPKWIANTSLTQVPGDTTSPPPQRPRLTALPASTCFLDQEMLDHIAATLNEEGAHDPDTNGWITLGEDGPIYPLYIGQEASAQLLLQNADLRQDRRFADMGDGNAAMLFKRIGATKVIKNFRHVINLFPPRYSWTGGAYTRVPTWVMTAGTKGLVADVNPDWRNPITAPYEGAKVLSPWVFTSEILEPVNSAAGLTWSPKNHVGEFQFVTGGREIFNDPTCYDPLKKQGAHFAEFWHAPKPIFPIYGAHIIFKRCPSANYPCTSCANS